MRKDSRLVYSTETGRIKAKPNQTHNTSPSDGIVRLQLETKGRKGKGVTTIRGIEETGAELKIRAKKLKQLCGTGGSVKNTIIEIQGDHRDKLKSHLEGLGFTVKIAGA